MFCVHSDGFRMCKFLILSMAGEAEIIVKIGFDHLESTWPSVGIVTVKTVHLGLKVYALLKVKPRLVMRLGMRLGISPCPRFKFIIVGQGLSQFIRFVVLVIPRKCESSIRKAAPPRMALATDFCASFKVQFPWMDYFPFHLGGLRRVQSQGRGISHIRCSVPHIWIHIPCRPSSVQAPCYDSLRNSFRKSSQRRVVSDCRPRCTSFADCREPIERLPGSIE